MNKKIFALTIVLSILFSMAVPINAFLSVNDEALYDFTDGIKNKIVAGYQGWHAMHGDGVINGAFHWPTEIWPDVSAYNSSDLFPSWFSNLGNSDSAELYSSARPGVVDQHFKWMQEYGIDVAAVQRVMIGSLDSLQWRHTNIVLDNVMHSAEKYGIQFYITYDITNYKHQAFDPYGTNDIYTGIIDDYRNSYIKDKYANSPAYLTVDDKPVIQIWGIGVNGNCVNITPQNCIDLIDFFHDEGFYVIGGIPTGWRTGQITDGYANFRNTDAYNKLDMISPWLTGRQLSITGSGAYTVESVYENIVADDIAYCREKGIDYMPVVAPGYAWYIQAGKADTRINQVKRDSGDFMWAQAVRAVDKGSDAIYIGMFDEYDEATSIIPAATDSSMIPQGEYFQTYSIDNTWLSSDFYLRLTNEIGRLLKGERTVVDYNEKHGLPYSKGPVYLRSSFEVIDNYRSDNNAFIGTYNLDVSMNPEMISGFGVTRVSGEKVIVGYSTIYDNIITGVTASHSEAGAESGEGWSPEFGIETIVNNYDLDPGKGWWMAHADGVNGSWIEFDLGSVCGLDSMTVSNFKVYDIPSVGMKNVIIEYSEDGETWHPFGEEGKFTFAFNSVDIIPFNGAVAQYVRITVDGGLNTGNYGFDWYGDGISGLVGLSAVIFRNQNDTIIGEEPIYGYSARSGKTAIKAEFDANSDVLAKILNVGYILCEADMKMRYYCIGTGIEEAVLALKYTDGTWLDIKPVKVSADANGWNCMEAGLGLSAGKIIEGIYVKHSGGNSMIDISLYYDDIIIEKGIVINSIETGNKQANVNFDIKSANGKGYTVYLSVDDGKTFDPYNDVNYNSKGTHIKDLTNGKIYYAYIEYNDGKNILKSSIVEFIPNK